MPNKQPFTAQDLYALKSVEDPQISPDGKHLAFVRVDVDQIGNKYERHIWLVRLDDPTPQPRQFTFGTKSDSSPRWSPDGRTLAFVSSRSDKAQIYLIGLDGGEARPLTTMPNGATAPTWSPNGKRLAFLSQVNAEERAREDAAPSDAPPANALDAKHRKELKDQAEQDKADPRIITRLPYRTGKDYLDDRRSHIYVLEVGDEARPPRRLTDGELDFNTLAWTHDSAALISTQSRQPDYEPWSYHALIRVAATGKRKPYRTLSRPGHEYSGAQVSPDGQWIATTRVEEDGSWGQTAHLVILPIAGGPAQELTTRLDRTVSAWAWASDSCALYFLAGDSGNVPVYRVSIEGGEVQTVVGGRRMVLGFSVAEGGQIAFVAHTPTAPAELYLAQPSGGAEQRLTRFNDDFLAQRHVAAIEEVTHLADDGAPGGRRIQGWLLKPIGYRKGQRYPLVVNMHGGPWVMWGPAMPHIWLEWQLHAARGYGVYFCNPRGSDGYGAEFSLIIRNDWGNHVMDDILSGVDNVLKRGWIDPKRLALTGGSYAGYMTAWIISHDPRFACAWAQRGLYNLTSFFGTSDVPQLIEREFQTMGFDELEKLWKQSPLAYVRNIHTPLAIEHQDNDWRCPPSEAEQLFAALKRLKREVIFVRYPREGHEMSRAGEPKHRVDRLERQVGWFDKYCQKKSRR